MLSLVNTITGLLWSDRATEASALLKEIETSDVNYPGLSDGKELVSSWMKHLDSKDSYTEFYRGHRSQFVPVESILSRHTTIGRLGQIRQWMGQYTPSRILDLGCFDGFAILNLCQAFTVPGIGVDLDTNALAHAARAAQELGVSCKFVEGFLEDIDLGIQFDAILLMEILEHVIDPKQALLSAEKHLAPGGRIYITTPASPVPHEGNEHEAREHVRLLSEGEMFSLLGDRLIEKHMVLDAGSHRERLLCYRRPKTLFVVNQVVGGWDPCDSKTYGGSEESVVELASVLSEVGHEVTVLHNRGEGESSDGVVHKGVRYTTTGGIEGDIVICVKCPQIIDSLGKHRAVFFWTMDPNIPQELPLSRITKIDKIVGISDFHKKELLSLNPQIKDEKVLAIPLGVQESLLNVDVPISREPHEMMYASSFDRGLDFLLDKWGEIKESVPDATLEVWYGWELFDKVGVTAQSSEWKLKMQEKLKQPGVHLRERTACDDPTPFVEAALLAYPCTGGERFCITGQKAQKLGCIPVVVPTMALKETIKHGCLVPDHSQYVDYLVSCLRDRKGQETIRKSMIQDPTVGLSWRYIYQKYWFPLWKDILRSVEVSKGPRTSVRKTQSLTACFITKNADVLFSRALRSIKDIAQEIIVVDQGSEDRTLDIAEQFKAKIIQDNSPLYCLTCQKEMPSDHYARTEHEPYGFEGPRNISISTATGDWILWIDSDEELLRSHNLVKYLRHNMFKGYAIRQHHFSAVPPNAFKPDMPVRVFRNGCGIHFYGKIHEHPESGINESVVPATVLSDVDIAHDGYLVEEVRRVKFQRNIGLMIADRRFHPERTLGKFLWIRDLLHLSRYSLEKSGGALTPEIVKNCQDAIDLYEKEFLGKSDLYATDGLDYYSEALRILNMGFEVSWSLSSALTSEPGLGEIKRARFRTVEIWEKTLGAFAKSSVDPFTGRYV